jgi:hypothetical protein
MVPDDFLRDPCHLFLMKRSLRSQFLADAHNDHPHLTPQRSRTPPVNSLLS